MSEGAKTWLAVLAGLVVTAVVAVVLFFTLGRQSEPTVLDAASGVLVSTPVPLPSVAFLPTSPPEPAPTVAIATAAPEPTRTPELVDNATLIADFSKLVEPRGFELRFTEPRGFFDGCGGPDSSEANSHVFENDVGTLAVLTIYPSADVAKQQFDALPRVSTPCDIFPGLFIEDIATQGPNDTLMVYGRENDSVTYREHYVLRGRTVLVASNPDGRLVTELLAIFGEA